MADKQDWGQCRDCKWWQLEPDDPVADHTLGYCIDEELQPFKLSVSGNSGCNRFIHGGPARAEGSSAQPPTVAPVR